MSADALRSELCNSWEVELEAVVSCPTWELKPKSVQTLPKQYVPLSAEPPYQSRSRLFYPQDKQRTLFQITVYLNVSLSINKS